MLNPPDSEFVPLKALLESRPKPRFAFDRRVQFGNILLGLIGDEFRLKPDFDRFSTVTFLDEKGRPVAMFSTEDSTARYADPTSQSLRTRDLGETGVPLSDNCNIDVLPRAYPHLMDIRLDPEHYEIRDGKIRRVQ